MNKDAIIKLVNEQMWAKTDADVPSFKAGDTITVSYKIIEGNKERVQSFRGVVIQIMSARMEKGVRVVFGSKEAVEAAKELFDRVETL